MSLNFDRVADEYDATRGGEERGAHVAADAMARRTYSSLWSVTDEQWRDLVEPAIAALRALGSGPMQRVKRERPLVLERRSNMYIIMQ